MYIINTKVLYSVIPITDSYIFLCKISRSVFSALTQICDWSNDDYATYFMRGHLSLDWQTLR